MSWTDQLRAAVRRLDEVGYQGLTQAERNVLAYLHTATANVAVPRDLDERKPALQDPL